MRGRLASVVLVLAAGCGGAAPEAEEAIAAPTGPIPECELMLRIRAGAAEVEFGAAFDLEVVRVWSRELVPEAWSDDLLAPLEVRLVGSSRREDAERVEETLRFRCHAFGRDRIQVPPPVFRAWRRDDRSERVALGEGLLLGIRSALDPDAPGPVELPGEPIPPPGPWLERTLLAAVALAALIVAWRLWRARVRRAYEVPPHELALERLQRLRERVPRGREELRSDSVEASSALRDYLAGRFEVRAPERTTEEVLEDPRTGSALAAEQRDALGEFLEHCDRVKFALHEPVAEERERQLDSAEGLVRKTSAEDADEPDGGGEGA